MIEQLIESIIANGEKFGLGLIADIAVVLVSYALIQAIRALIRLSADKQKGMSENASLVAQALGLYGQTVTVMGELRETLAKSNTAAEARDGRLVAALGALEGVVSTANRTSTDTLAESKAIKSLLEAMPSALAAQTQSVVDEAAERIVAEYQPILSALVDLKAGLGDVESRVLGELRGAVGTVEERVLGQISQFAARIGEAEKSILQAIRERVSHEEKQSVGLGLGAIVADGGGSGSAGSAIAIAH